MRGYVITILSVSLIVILVVLAISLRNTHLSIDRALSEPLPLTYAAFLLDDVACEFSSLFGPQLRFDQRNDSMVVTVTDTIHAYNHSADISAYKAFLAGEVANRTNSNITADFNNLTGGTMRVFIDEDYVYTNDHRSSEMIFTRDGGTGARSYDINFTVSAVRSNVTHMDFNGSGTMNVTIRYTDLNGTETESGAVFPDQPNTLRVDYANGGSLAVTTGLAGGNGGSLRMKASGSIADAAWTVALPALDAAKKRGYEYDATISYVQGRVSKSCRLGK